MSSEPENTSNVDPSVPPLVPDMEAMKAMYEMNLRLQTEKELLDRQILD